MIRNVVNFFSGSNDATEFIKFKIFIDKIKTKSIESYVLKVEKEMKIKNLRKKIANYIEINEDEIVLMIAGKFWDDEKSVKEVLREVRSSRDTYELRAVIVTFKEQEAIDYDLEIYLRQKYSAVTKSESEYVLTDYVVSKNEVSKNISVICNKCKKKKPKDLVHTLDYCGHEFCKDCLVDVINNFCGNPVQCPYERCKRILFDHEIQKILGAVLYRKWEDTVYRKSNKNDDFIMSKSGWICQTCTFLNKPFVKLCDACNDNCPKDYRIPIFYQLSDEDKLEKKKLDEQVKEEEEEKSRHLEVLRDLSKQSVTYTYETTECPVCLIEYDAGKAIVLHSCLHTICKDCLQNYLVNIEDAAVKCPTENCMGLLEDREISAILTQEQYETYQELNLRMAEAKEQLSFHCKEVNCQGWIVHDGFLNDFNCPRCGKKNCIKCEAIHDDMSCQEYQLQRLIDGPDPNQTKNDLYIQSMINAGNAMKCPGCKMIVEKNRGCDGVLCRSCGIMICWATKGPRWGPKGKGDTSGGCGCRFFWGRRCHSSCRYCH